MALKFRLNRYNWFGQKLLAQHEYNDIIYLHQYLTKSANLDQTEPASSQVIRWTSEHLIYINGLALLKTSTRLDEVIYSLQQLNFDQNSQYFLLLCQCLLYIGNYDSVVEICKQAINKELDATIIIDDQQDERRRNDESEITSQDEQGELLSSQERRKFWLESAKPEVSFEFKSLFGNTKNKKNKLIHEPKLWFIFGLCLELQRQFKSAFFAFKIASNMASGKQLNGGQLNDVDKLIIGTGSGGDTSSGLYSNTEDGVSKICISNYCSPHLKYVDFCVKHKADFKSAIQTLQQVSSMFPQNYTLHPKLALLFASQPSLNQANFVKSIEIISNLEMHSSANRNPSSGYNKIAAKFNTFDQANDNLNQLNRINNHLSETSDENRSSLDYLLIKSYLIINSIVQDSAKLDCSIYRTNFNGQRGESLSAADNELLKRAETLIEELKGSQISCWDSASLWNNLGICYLVKKKFIACLSCLMKASQLNALDWRINYNLALACIHVGLYTKALACLVAANNIYSAKQKYNFCSRVSSLVRDKLSGVKVDPIINTLMAICYDKLNEEDEARTLFIEAIRPQKGVPIISLVNYLIFLHSFGREEKQFVKLKLHLLDQLEQFWLQRSQNDCQFNTSLLEVARIVGDETLDSVEDNKSAIKKTYAWTKS